MVSSSSGRISDYPVHSRTNSTLLTQGFMSENAYAQHNHLGLCILHILLALWVCLANISQIINIVLGPALRRQAKNVLVVNLCAVELVMGGFLCPLYSDSLMQGTWRHNIAVCIVYEVIFYTQVGVSTLAVLVLVVERFYFLITPRMMDGAGKGLLTSILFLLPWLIGAALIVPLFLNGATASFNGETDTCQIIWKKKFQTVTVFVSYFCPAFLVLTMAAAVVMMYVLFTVIAKRRDIGIDPDRKLMKDSLRVVLLASFTCVILQFPFFIALLMEMFCLAGDSGQPCGQSETTWAVVMVIIMLKPGLMPLTFLAYRDVRDGFKVGTWTRTIFSRRPRRHRSSVVEDDSAVSLSGLARSTQTILTSSSF